MTGSSYFSASRCTDAMKAAKKNVPDFYRVSMGAMFHDTELIKSTERLATMVVSDDF